MIDISVVVPTYERGASLERCLRALAGQTLPRFGFEVIICDDGSRVPVADSQATALSALADRISLRVIRQPNAGPAAARNRGAAAAAGHYIAFTDDDCRPEPDWLERLLEAFDSRPEVVLGGALRAPPRTNRYARATQAIMDFVYVEQAKRPGMRLFSTSNLALPARVFRRLGGFSQAFRRPAGEDYDLCARWYGSGGSLEYVADAVVVHDPELTLASFVRQHFTYGRGLLHMRRRLRKQGMDPQRTLGHSMPGFYLRLIYSPLRSYGLRGADRAVLVALSQAVTTAGAISEILRPHVPARDSGDRAGAGRSA